MKSYLKKDYLKKKRSYSCIIQQHNYLWTGFLNLKKKRTLEALEANQIAFVFIFLWPDGIFEKSINLNQHQIGTIFMIITQRGQLLLSRACFWSGPLIDSHFVLILVSGNDPHIWTAEFLERSLRNDIKTTNRTGKHVQPRLTRETHFFIPLSHYLFSVQMITCHRFHHFMFMSSLSFVISLASLYVCAHLS